MMLDRSRSRGDVSFASRHIQQPVHKKGIRFSSIKKKQNYIILADSSEALVAEVESSRNEGRHTI